MSKGRTKVSAGEISRRRVGEMQVPARVLVVDGDELEAHLMASRLGAAGFDVELASDAAAAMNAIDARWFPLILLDRSVLDGNADFVEQLRGRGGEDSFVVVLSVEGSSEFRAPDTEIGRDTAGVDDFISKKWPDAELRARLAAGQHTVALRRSLRESRAELAARAAKLATQDPATSDARQQLLSRLQSEAVRARRYKRSCSVLLLGVHAASGDAQVDGDLQTTLLQALRGTIRLDIDAIALYATGPKHLQYAIVLPEAGPAEVASIRHRVRTTIVQRLREAVPAANFHVSIGAASVDTGGEEATGGAYAEAEKLLQSAQLCGECMASRGAQRLAAVQSSVVNHVSIPCRHGYAVADHCQELAAAGVDRQQVLAAAPG